MSLYTICVLLLLLKLHQVTTVMYSHTISEDTTWYYQQLTTEPSLIVEIEFSIVCIHAKHSFKYDLYKTKDHINIEKKCSFQANGQLHNEHLWVPLRSGNFKENVCLKDKNGLLHCTGKTVIQDFKPRRISFSFGKACEYTDEALLKGLSFNISVSGQRNKTDCVPLYNRNMLNCVKFYPFASFPNLFGSQQQEALDMAEEMVLVSNQGPVGCYKFLLEMSCYLFIPKCDVTRRVTIPPCRETCWDFINGCLGVAQKLFKDNALKTFLNCNYLPAVGSDIKCFYKAVTCEPPPKVPHGKIEDGAITYGTYPLHTQLNIECLNKTFVIKGNSTITCQYTGTWSQPPQCVLRACPAPPTVEHAHFEENQNVNEVYPWHTQVTYVCDNKTFYMEGNSTITCLKNEHWTPAPECVKVIPDTINQDKLKTLEIVLPTVFIVLLTVISSCLVILYKRRLKLKGNSLSDAFTLDNVDLTRMKKYDAFVCYQFDADDAFVKNEIIPEFEQNHDPPFKLFISENDFEPGYSIIKNMQAAIQNSNSVILVMSQGFVDSPWCQQEFEYCHTEHMNDPAFKLFIILMQPVESLKNLSECMKQYFVQETYLQKDDEKLFTKIASYLTLVKQPKDDEDASGGIEVNPEVEQDHLENEGGIPADVPADEAQNDTDVNNDHRHENISNETENGNDVHVIVHNIDDVIDNDENVPLLFN